MNKKLFFTILSTVIVLAGAVSATVYFLSFHTITFEMKDTDATASIFKADDTDKKNEIIKVKNNDISRLQEGNYAARVNGEKYDSTPIRFSVGKNDATITIEPSYSLDYLTSLLETERPKIIKAIEETFPTVMPGFTMGESKLYKKGEWYAGTLIQNVQDPSSDGDIYHVILHKENATWRVVHTPQLVLTTSVFKEVPKDILQDANRMGD